VLAVCVLLAAGCRPPGPRALVEGKRLIDHGKYVQAVDALKTATSPASLVSTNAQAWNYLGLACHYAGQADDAQRAYQRALILNPELAEARYNLGCLWLGQGKLEAAKGEFIAYTLRRPNSVEGFLKLGAVLMRASEHHGPQLRSMELGAAEKSFNDALRLSPQNPEAWNALGLIRLEQGRTAEAEQCFSNALKQPPLYRPALLNSAIVAQQYLRDRPSALQNYREYLDLKPAPDDAEAVKAVVRQLESELKPEEPALKPAQESSAAPASGQVSSEAAGAAPVTLTNAPQAKVAKRSFLQRLFGSHPKAPAGTQTAGQAESANMTGTSSDGAGFAKGVAARYAYRSPVRPSPGNHSEANRSFEQGILAQRARRLGEAVRDYRQATLADPSFFEAQYNLGLTEAAAGDLPAALAAYENALALRPESLDARYNFALVLQRANYPADAANELEKVLAGYPNDVRAHLALGTLYAQQFHQPAKARPHYLKALEADPRNSQADAIRHWLAQNP
jgi:tetratricopeptide (TPR) repeat protein